MYYRRSIERKLMTSSALLQGPDFKLFSMKLQNVSKNQQKQEDGRSSKVASLRIPLRHLDQRVTYQDNRVPVRCADPEVLQSEMHRVN